MCIASFVGKGFLLDYNQIPISNTICFFVFVPHCIDKMQLEITYRQISFCDILLLLNYKNSKKNGKNRFNVGMGVSPKKLHVQVGSPRSQKEIRPKLLGGPMLLNKQKETIYLKQNEAAQCVKDL